MEAAELDAMLGSDAAAREESWRYSRNALRALTQQPFAVADAAAAPPADLLARCAWPETDGARLVFVNGVYAPAYSHVRASNADVQIAHEDGRCVLRVRNASQRLIHIVHANVPGAAAARWSAALRIELEQGSADVIEQHIGVHGDEMFGALHAQWHVGVAACLRVIVITDLPDTVSLYRHEQVRVAANARYRATHALFGGRLQRLDLCTDLAEAGARCEQCGVFAPRGREHIDVQLDVRHAARDCASDVLWRGVADQRGRGILRGAITVAAGADGADAQLQTRNLLLSPHAEIDAQPVLEIYADEVKASHGATVGQLDPLALFYLRSRGVPLLQARALLLSGFCREALQQAADLPLAARLEALLATRLPQTQGAVDEVHA